MLFKVAGFADAQRRREATAAGGAPTCMCTLDLHTFACCRIETHL